MGKHAVLKITESLKELKTKLKAQRKSKNIDRIRSLIFIKEKKFETRQELASVLGYHIRTMERWLASYREGGITKMIIPDVLERDPHIIAPRIHKGLSKRAYNGHIGFKSYVEAQHWANQQYNAQVEYHTLRVYLTKHFKTRIKSPRKSHIKKDEKAVDAFLKTPKHT